MKAPIFLAASIAAVAAGVGALAVATAPSAAMIADNKADIDRCIEQKGDTDACDRIKTTRGYVLDGYQPTIDIALGLRKDALAQAEVIAEAQKAEAEAQRAEARKQADIALAKQEEARKQAAAELKAQGDWIYGTYVDDATGKTAKTGRLISENTMNFDFPYSGTQHGQFVVRNHPRYGVDAYLTIEQGQLLCDSYSNTTVLVRFDNGAATAYSCNEPADHSSKTVFIEGVGRLEAGMKTAKKMFVTVSVYGEGSRTWEFNVKNYNSSKI